MVQKKRKRRQRSSIAEEKRKWIEEWTGIVEVTKNGMTNDTSFIELLK